MVIFNSYVKLPEGTLQSNMACWLTGRFIILHLVPHQSLFDTSMRRCPLPYLNYYRRIGKSWWILPSERHWLGFGLGKLLQMIYIYINIYIYMFINWCNATPFFSEASWKNDGKWWPWVVGWDAFQGCLETFPRRLIEYELGPSLVTRCHKSEFFWDIWSTSGGDKHETIYSKNSWTMLFCRLKSMDLLE